MYVHKMTLKKHFKLNYSLLKILPPSVKEFELLKITICPLLKNFEIRLIERTIELPLILYYY